MAHLLIQRGKVVPGLAPQTMAGAADGDWVSMKGYHRLVVLVHLTQGNAATTAITVDKATDVAGTGVSAGITLSRNWSIEDTAIGTDAGTNSDTWVAGASAAAITTSNTGTGASMYAIEIFSGDLITGASAFGTAFDCVQVKLGASDANNIAQVTYILEPSRYAQGVSPTPSAIID